MNHSKCLWRGLGMFHFNSSPPILRDLEGVPELLREHRVIALRKWLPWATRKTCCTRPCAPVSHGGPLPLLTLTAPPIHKDLQVTAQSTINGTKGRWMEAWDSSVRKLHHSDIPGVLHTFFSSLYAQETWSSNSHIISPNPSPFLLPILMIPLLAFFFDYASNCKYLPEFHYSLSDGG